LIIALHVLLIFKQFLDFLYLDNKSQGRTNRSHCTYTPLVLCQTINYCSYLHCISK